MCLTDREIAKIQESIVLLAGGKRSEKSDLLADMTRCDRLLLTKAAIHVGHRILRSYRLGSHRSSLGLEPHQEGYSAPQIANEETKNNLNLVLKFFLTF